jgi:hypothetical protein
MFLRLVVPAVALLFPALALAEEEPIPSTEAPPQVQPAEAPAATPEETVAPVPAPAANQWRVATVKVPVPGTFGGVREELRVLREDGSAISVGDGLADAGDPKTIRAHTPFPEDAPLSVSSIAQHVVVLGGGGVLLAAGAVALLVSAFFAYWNWTNTAPSGLPKGAQYDVGSFVPAGPALVLASVLVMATGTATLVATGIHWGLGISRGPAAVDLSVLDPLKGTFGWDASEASDVVKRHNERTVAAAAR